MVCTECVEQLREAFNFRDQVIRAETHFTNCYIHTDHIDRIIQSDIKEAEKYSFIEDERKKEKLEDDMVLKRNHKIDPEDYDSDTPIALLLKNRFSPIIYKCEEDNMNGNTEGNADIHIASPKKNVSERKKGIVTCHTVLKETTACPFRHHKSWFRCFFCPKDFVEINQLRDHTFRTHTDLDSELKKIKRYPRSLQIEISNLECRNCHIDLMDVSEMCRHLCETHNMIVYSECIADFKLGALPYSCHMCKQQFHVFRTLTTHLNEHYANCVCDVCGKSFLNSKRLKVHKRTHETGQFPCTECGKVLKSLNSRMNHIESAHSKRQIKCQICFKPMKHYNDRVKHMSDVHNITHKFPCIICGREFNVKQYLTTHLRQTHGQKNKKCVECGMAFITNNGLKKHMVRHSGDKPFSCNICGKSYGRSYTLKDHLKGHELNGTVTVSN
ncbi:hypothetical protein ACJJTC_019194 [Scirpophaga incertulas]